MPLPLKLQVYVSGINQQIFQSSCIFLESGTGIRISRKNPWKFNRTHKLYFACLLEIWHIADMHFLPITKSIFVLYITDTSMHIYDKINTILKTHQSVAETEIVWSTLLSILHIFYSYKNFIWTAFPDLTAQRFFTTQNLTIC